MTFGEQIKKLREDACLSRVEFAKKAKLDTSHVWRLESGESRPRVATLVRIAEALGVAPSVLLDSLQ